jgi:hypothetical protein
MATETQHINQTLLHMPPYLFNLLFERQHIKSINFLHKLFSQKSGKGAELA